MFFIGIFGTNSKVVPCGEISVDRCPVCGRPSRMHVSRCYDYFHAFFLPLFQYHIHYIATCPHCASAFALDQEVGRQAQKMGSAACGSGCLRLLRSNLPLRCPACGAQQPPGSRFCNQCGAPLA